MPLAYVPSLALILLGVFIGFNLSPRARPVCVTPHATPAVLRSSPGPTSVPAGPAPTPGARERTDGIATTLVSAAGFHVLVPWRAFFFTPEATGRTHARMFDLPRAVRRVWVEVGVYTKTDFWDLLERGENKDVAVIGFEPNVDFVRTHPPHARVFLLPAAVANFSDFAVFKQWSPTGGSLYGIGPAHEVYLSEDQLHPARDRVFEVPVLPLEAVLRHVPAHVSIEYLKVDAQGADMSAVVSAGAELSRVAGVTAECQDLPNHHDPRRFYATSCLSHELRSFMKAQGFGHSDCVLQNAELEEENCHFGKTAADLDRARTLFRGL